MLYDLNNEYHREQAKARFEKLMSKRCVIDITEKTNRTLPQNRYLHACLGCVALHLGEKLEDVKRFIFKIKVNPDIFIEEKHIKGVGLVKKLRSSADISKDEMITAIERLRNWASQEEGIYIPSSDEHLLIQQMEIEYERTKQYL